jgi:hypothetical protein
LWFYDHPDISFVEATPRYDPVNKLAVSIEVTKFFVYYNQAAADAAILAMKGSKSEVMCEQGHLYKASNILQARIDRPAGHQNVETADFSIRSRKTGCKLLRVMVSVAQPKIRPVTS